MSDSERSPLLSDSGRSTPPTAQQDDDTVESTPLLSGSDSTPRYDGHEQHANSDAASIRSHATDAQSIRSTKKKSRRWPSIIAMIILALLSVSIIVVAFFVPAAVEEYAKQAAVIEPTNLSLESISADGVRVRVQANFRLDGQRVQNEHVRRVGRTATWIVRKLGTEETRVQVYLPQYDNVMIGSASVPPLTINIMDGHTTAINIVADLAPGDADGIRTIANEWLDGRLDVVRVQAKADVHIKSGIIPLGTHAVSEYITVEGQSLYRSFASLYFGERTLF